MNKYDIEDWITFVKRLEEKNLKTPFHSFFLQFIDSSGTHVIHYVDRFEESKSAVIHQLNKILRFPQNYIDVNVFVTTVEPPEHDRTYILGATGKITDGTRR